MELQRMRLFLHTVFCLKDISEASAKKPKTLSEYQIAMGWVFLFSQHSELRMSFAATQSATSSAGCLLFCSHIHKFFSFVRGTEQSMRIVLPGRWWSNNEALWLSSVGTSYLPHWVGGTISSKSNYLCRTCWLHWVSTPWHKECLLNLRNFKRSPFAANFKF